ncbi:MAG: TOBE domain-containing protein [Phyllobacteriaceae bacterium]|nr:TOBE domain-containing protein [Phyllobacteriaceae bacterium]
MPAALSAGDRFTVMARPEDVVITPGHMSDGLNRLSGKVSFIRDIGHLIELLVETDGAEILAVMTPKDCPEVTVGENVTATIPAAACLALAC